MGHRPSFFKIMYPGLTSHHLRIPPKFLKHIETDLSDMATVKGPSGKSWKVTVSKRMCGIYLENGWVEFLRDNNVNDYEFMVFSYDGNMCFSVRVFGKSTCEKVNAHFGENPQPEPSNRKRKPGRPRKSIEPTLQPGQRFPCHESCGEDEDEDEKPILKSGGSRAEEPLKGAEFFTSKNPHFEKTMTSASTTKGFFMYIPKVFAKLAHLPLALSHVIVRNLEGNGWVVNCVFAQGKHFLSGGWSSFVRSNNLKVGDVCIFELLGKQEIQVHIFPL